MELLKFVPGYKKSDGHVYLCWYGTVKNLITYFMIRADEDQRRLGDHAIPDLILKERHPTVDNQVFTIYFKNKLGGVKI